METKYKITDITGDVITVNADIKQERLFNGHNNNIRWQLAKDDVSPDFLYQGQNATKRANVASYCVQDCALCITLMNKLIFLLIILVSICYVPLSFIFLRGQGIKIFSLVSKECKSENFLIPLVRPKRDEMRKNIDSDSDEGVTFDYDFTDKFTPEKTWKIWSGMMMVDTKVLLY